MPDVYGGWGMFYVYGVSFLVWKQILIESNIVVYLQYGTFLYGLYQIFVSLFQSIDMSILFANTWHVLPWDLQQVHEGRNHEVRELVKNAGLQVC